MAESCNFRMVIKFRFRVAGRGCSENTKSDLKMKAIILLITMVLGAVIITSAQETKTGKNFQQKKFNTEVLTDSAIYFVNSPTFKTDTSPVKILHFQKLPGDIFTQNNQVKNDFFANRQKPEFRMPLADGGNNYFNMPVAVPDSTVEYYIKNKQIDYVNPLEKKYK